ncbi:MAG TPA: hypothetical protein ENK60_07590 [Anaerolineae bacterium]|nr:hypothetical protein [Anaerolineae bacterium]
MSLTVRLSDFVYEARDYRGIEVGAALNVMLTTPMLGRATYDDVVGWFDIAQEPLQPVLAQVEGATYAFAGQVRKHFLFENPDLSIAYLLVDTPTPITLQASEFDDLAPDVEEGDWVYGVTTLSLAWEDSLDLPLGQPIQAVIEDIRRLYLHPGPGFGLVQSVHSLPPEPLGPDQVWLMIRTQIERR